MTLANKIKINTHYTRSINLERDADTLDVVKSYIPTSRALKTLERVTESFKTDQSPRAWALVGPYGSGKSSFAVYLTHLLGQPDLPNSKAAYNVLRKSNPSLARKFNKNIKDTWGFCSVLLTGSPEPMANRLVESLCENAQKYWENKRGRSPAIVDKLAKAKKKKENTITAILNLVVELQDAIAKVGGAGLLIVVDELGKFLEYEARHHGANDIYLLQALAEHACAGHSANLSIFVLQHQSFELYAKGLGESHKNEWAKVQGRFENIPFLESTEQVLRVVSAAFVNDFDSTEQIKIKKLAATVAKVFAKHKALPSALDESTAASLFANCYPLHPVSTLLLPSLCQKVAQNERTLFSYLGSQEVHGFKDSLASINEVGEWIYPWEIYEYFILNQPAVISDHFTHRRWAEVVTAIERLGDAADTETHLLKTIGLLNIVGAQGGFKASQDIVDLCAPQKKDAKVAVKSLVDKSIVQFRKFSAEYRVWQGSDFDLDAAVDEERSKLGQFELAAYLNERKYLLPLVARKYTIKTGALRYFSPVFADAATYRKVDKQSSNPRIIFCLVDTQEGQEIFEASIKAYYSPLDIVVKCLNGDRLRDAVSEVLALENIRVTAQELNSDPVAKREFNDRFAVAESEEDEILRRLVDDPTSNEWYWSNERLNITNKRALQNELSKILENIYHASPVIQNELINRDKPSAQANAARNKLLYLMLQHGDKEDLNIEKYPAEKGIYRALLKATRLHREVDGEWQFSAPGPRKDPFNLIPVWKRIEQFLLDTEKSPFSFLDLNDELMAPPYGVKEGVLPFLYFHSLLVNQHELALYEDGVYAPYLTEEQVERFARRPGDFKVQRFRIEGMRASIFKEYAKALYGNAYGEQDLLSIARPLAKFMGDLPEYTRRTKRVSKQAQKMRNAFNLAKTPEKLLFDALPNAFGLSEINPKLQQEDELKGFSDKLIKTIRELKYAYDSLIDEQRMLFCQAFNLGKKTTIKDLRSILRGRLEGLQSYTVDVDGLRAFIQRTCKTSNVDDAWFVNVLMFLASSKPPKKWTDSDRDTVEFKLSEYSRRISDLEKLRIEYDRRKLGENGEFDAILLKTIRRGAKENDEIAVIDKRANKVVNQAKNEMLVQLNNLNDKEIKLAVLAKLVDEFLSSYHKQDAKNTNRDEKQEGINQLDLIAKEE